MVKIIEPSAPSLSHRFMATFFLNRVPSVSAADMRFQRISGLSREMSVKTINEGGDNVGSRHLPERVTFGNVVLERGVMPTTMLTDWLGRVFNDFDISVLGIAEVGKAVNGVMHRLDAKVPGQLTQKALDQFSDGLTAIIMLLDEHDLPISSWTLTGVVPIRWQVGDLDASSNTVLINTMELAYHRMRWLGVRA
ncbi:phage tail protein [Mycetohabitans rhizoxinica]|uniref:Phage tail protein n=1 Tax=Mycetohabitans rhizoxinica TaxID=412963 RepID=A0ABZ2PW42_9BURK